jgi:hypothetical protein
MFWSDKYVIQNVIELDPSLPIISMKGINYSTKFYSKHKVINGDFSKIHEFINLYPHFFIITNEDQRATIGKDFNEIGKFGDSFLYEYFKK